MLKKIISGLLLFSVVSAHAATLRQIVVFGDSLSDNGNLYEYMHHQLPLSPPYYQGRFTNGPVWVELLTQKYYPQDSAAHLLDYAFGGSGVEGQNDEPDDTLFTLNREVDSFLLAHQDKVDPNNLYIIWMGANNYFALPDELDASVSDVIWGIHANVDRLIAKGAKYILLLNLPNLGQLPIAREIDAEASLTYCATQHNLAMEKGIQQWQAQNPDVKLMLFDVSKDFADMILNPSNHAMTNVTDTCYEALLDSQAKSKTVLKMVSSVHKKRNAQDACAGFMFFDPVHPSIIVHQEIADKIALLLKAARIRFA